MSRKVVLYIATSIDGYIADTNGGIDWLGDVEITEEDHNYEEFFSTIDTVLLGRTTYDQITKELSPESYPYEEKESIVFTSMKREYTESIRFTNENIVNVIEELKKEPNKKDIWVVGGNSLVMPLVKENLIDEYKLCTIPILLGDGISLFDTFAPAINLTTKSVQVKNSMIYQHFIKK